jgi:hypothetical protein
MVLDGGSIPGRGRRFYSSAQRPDRLWAPNSLLSNVYPRVKRPRREADSSSQTSAEVKNAGAVLLSHTSSWLGA